MSPQIIHNTTQILPWREKRSTFNESKQAVTFPFWMSTWAGGCAKRHSSSVREQVPRWNSLQTSTSNHLGSLPMTGTIIFGLSKSWLSFSVSKHLTRKGGNHELNTFFPAPNLAMRTRFPISPEVWGILYLATKHHACSLGPKHRGLELHNNESSITCGGQGQWRSEISFPSRQQSRKKLWKSETS